VSGVECEGETHNIAASDIMWIYEQKNCPFTQLDRDFLAPLYPVTALEFLALVPTGDMAYDDLEACLLVLFSKKNGIVLTTPNSL